MDFNVAEYEKSIEYDFTFHIVVTFKNLLPVEFWCSIKEENPYLSEKLFKILLFFLSTHMLGLDFPYILALTTTYYYRLNTGKDMRM